MTQECHKDSGTNAGFLRNNVRDVSANQAYVREIVRRDVLVLKHRAGKISNDEYLNAVIVYLKQIGVILLGRHNQPETHTA